MKDPIFQKELENMIEDPDVHDREIVKHVLDHAWNQWPHSFEQWLWRKRKHGGFE